MQKGFIKGFQLGIFFLHLRSPVERKEPEDQDEEPYSDERDVVALDAGGWRDSSSCGGAADGVRGRAPEAAEAGAHHKAGCERNLYVFFRL